MAVLVVVAGPQASGKSTIAQSLGDALRRQGERVAVVGLDAIAAMALPTLPGWEAAHRIFETVTALWAGTELTCVIAEGSGSQAEVTRVIEAAPPDVSTLTVAVTTTLASAYARAAADPTRGISRNYDFLEDVYARWPKELERMAPDLLLDTSQVDLSTSVATVMREVWQRLEPEPTG